MPWIIPCAGFAIFSFANSAISTMGVTYIVDSYKDVSGTGFKE